MLTTIDWVVAAFDQVYVSAVEAVNVTVSPSHNSVAPLIATVGTGALDTFTVTADEVASHPLASSIVTE